MSDVAKKRYVHVIRETYCKGCNICVALCPRKVLSLRSGKVFEEMPDLCIGCRLCELRCPDFTIEVQEQAEQPDYDSPPEVLHD